MGIKIQLIREVKTQIKKILTAWQTKAITINTHILEQLIVELIPILHLYQEVTQAVKKFKFRRW